MPPYMAQSPGYTLEEPPASSSNNSSNGVHPHGSPSQQPISPPRTCQGEDPRTSSRIRDPSRHQNPRPPHSSSSQESRSPYTPVYTGQSSTPSNPRTYQRADPRTPSRIRDPSRHQNPRQPHSSSSQKSYPPAYTGQSSIPSNISNDWPNRLFPVRIKKQTTSSPRKMTYQREAPPASSRDSNCQQYPPPSGSSSPLDSWLEAPGIEFIGCKWHIIRNGIVYTTWTKTSHQEACLEKKKKDSSQHPDSLRTPSYSYQPPPRVAPSSQPHEELGYPQVSENQASDGDSNQRSQEENEEDYSTESPPYITTAEELANPRFGIDSSSEYDSRSPSLPTDSEKNFGVSEQPVRHHHRTSMPSSATIGPRRDPNPMKPRAQKRKDPSDLFGNIMNNWNSQPKSSVVHEPKKFPAVKKTRK